MDGKQARLAFTCRRRVSFPPTFQSAKATSPDLSTSCWRKKLVTLANFLVVLGGRKHQWLRVFYEQCRPSAFVDASYCSLVSLTLQSQIHCEVRGAHISPINTQTNKQTNKHCQEKNIQCWRRNMSQVFCYFWEGDRCLVSCCPQALLNLDPVCCEGSLFPLECNQPKYWFVAVCCLGGILCSHVKILNLITGLLPLVVWGIGALPLS